MSELPKTQEDHKQASYNAVMTAFLILKEARIRLEGDQFRWEPKKDEQRSKMDARLASYQNQLHQLKNP